MENRCNCRHPSAARMTPAEYCVTATRSSVPSTVTIFVLGVPPSFISADSTAFTAGSFGSFTFLTEGSPVPSLFLDERIAPGCQLRRRRRRHRDALRRAGEERRGARHQPRLPAQTAGPTVALNGATAAKPTFTAPTGPATTVTVEAPAVVAETDIARSATATASSQSPSWGQTAAKAIDGVISRLPQQLRSRVGYRMRQGGQLAAAESGRRSTQSTGSSSTTGRTKTTRSPPAP